MVASLLSWQHLLHRLNMIRTSTWHRFQIPVWTSHGRFRTSPWEVPPWSEAASKTTSAPPMCLNRATQPSSSTARLNTPWRAIAPTRHAFSGKTSAPTHESTIKKWSKSYDPKPWQYQFALMEPNGNWWNRMVMISPWYYRHPHWIKHGSICSPKAPAWAPDFQRWSGRSGGQLRLCWASKGIVKKQSLSNLACF